MNGPFDGRRVGFAECGEDVTIYKWTRILGADRIIVDNHVITHDFSFVDGKVG